jgi:hypothetical protein
MEAVGPVHAIPVRSDCPPMHPPPDPRIYNVDPDESVQEPEEPSLLLSGSGVETVEFIEGVKSTPGTVKSDPGAVKSVPEAETQFPTKRGAAGVEDILMEDDVPVVEAAVPVATKSSATGVEETLMETEDAAEQFSTMLGAAHVEEILMKEDTHTEAVEPFKTTPRDLLEDIKR